MAGIDAAAVEAGVGGLSAESKHAGVLCADAVKELVSHDATLTEVPELDEYAVPRVCTHW